MITMQANAEQILKLRDKMVKLRAKAASSTFPGEVKLYIAKVDELHKIVLDLQAKVDEELHTVLDALADCPDSIGGEHDFCDECCCHGDCRDCGYTNPEYDAKANLCPHA